MGLGKVLELAASPTNIKEILKKGLREERELRPLHKESFIRVSALASLCPREEVICSIDDLTRVDTVEADLSMIFVHGTSLHWGLQNHVLPRVEILVGVWRCNGCGQKYGELEEHKGLSGLIHRPKRCTDCEETEFTYEEQHFVNTQYRVTGHPDGFLVIPGLPGKGIIEAKSIGKGWEVKDTPKMDHVIQAQCYLWLTDLKWAKILYWEKGAHGVGALIEHHIERDEHAIAEIKKVLLSIWDGIRDQTLPQRICADRYCPRAKGCAVVDRCFKDVP